MKIHNILAINIGTKEFAQDFRLASNSRNVQLEEIQSKNCIFTIVNNEVNLYHQNQKIDINKFDYAFMRLKGKKSHMSTLITKHLSYSNIPFNDKVNLSTTLTESEKNLFNDEKITQMLLLAYENLSIPNTIIFSQNSYLKNQETISKKISFPCVLKTTGAKGKSVWKIKNQDELELKISEQEHELMILQELLVMDYDIRVLIFNQEFLGAIKRTSTDGFYTNVSKGGTAEKIDLSDNEIELSKKACIACGIDFGGVDFARTPEGIKFFEVNKSPQAKGFTLATKINVPEKILNNIINYLTVSSK